MKEQHFLNSNVKVRLNNNFVLYGTVVDETDAGIWLKTRTETSFLNYEQIASIKVGN